MNILTIECDDNNKILDVGSPAGKLFWSVLQYYCAIGNFGQVRRCLEIREPVQDPKMERDGYHCIHIAARYGQSEIMQLLLDHSFFLNAVDQHGFTPLHYATLNNHLDTVKLLIKHGASPDTKSLAGYSAVDIAHEKHLTEILQTFSSVTMIDIAGHSKISAWLESIGLEIYNQGFAAAGYDDINYIREKGLDSDDLDAIGVVKLGHRKKLEHLYLLEDDSSEDEEDSEEDSSSSEEDSSSEEEDSSSDDED